MMLTRADRPRRSERTLQDPDLLHLVAQAHRRFDHALLDLGNRSTDERRASLPELTTDLCIHEALVEVQLYPLVASRVATGRALVRERLLDTERLTELLRELRSPHARVEDVARFRQLLLEHTDRLEIEVFPLLRHVTDDRLLRRLGTDFLRVRNRLRRELRSVTRSEPLTLAALRTEAARHLDVHRTASDVILPD